MIPDSTICAIATPHGTGAIAIIRLSGSDTYPVLEKIFKPRRNISIRSVPSHTVLFGKITDGSDTIDESLVMCFRGPTSYTGEDLAEISCHGSLYIQNRILNLLIRHGARLARAGEFTQRAFMNGKMDLAQAEAVADVIASESKASHRLAIEQMRGGFSREISTLRSRLLEFATMIELELDFSEEDVEFADRSRLKALIGEIRQVIDRLVQSFQLGNVLKNGVPVAIAGRTNVGKSTLLNALLNEEKAIVSDIHGTTRDAIEDVISIGGVAFRFIDTAGLRETTDTIEKIGIERSYDRIAKAKIILYIIEAGDNSNDARTQIQAINTEDRQQLIVIINKADMYPAEQTAKLIDALNLPAPVLVISAKSGAGIEQLKQILSDTVQGSGQGEVIVTNARHYEALQKLSLIHI